MNIEDFLSSSPEEPDFDAMVNQMLGELNSPYSTWESLKAAIEGPFDSKICRWVYGLGQQVKVKGGKVLTREEMHKRLDELRIKYPDKIKFVDNQVTQYFECAMGGYEGLPWDHFEDANGIPSWLLWGGVAAAGALLIWGVTRK